MAEATETLAASPIEKLRDRAVNGYAVLRMGAAALGRDYDPRQLRPDDYDRTYEAPPYYETASAAYKSASEEVDTAVQAGRLSAERVIDYNETLAEEAISLRPAYEVMRTAGLQPKVIFSPKHFEMREWHELLAGYAMPYSVTSRRWTTLIDQAYLVWNKALNGRQAESEYTRGIKNEQRRYLGTYGPAEEPERTDPLMPVVNDSRRRWEVSVMSTTNGPAAVGVSPDGSVGRGKITKLRNMLGVDEDLTDQQASALMSPRINVYNALQWSRISDGILPVDIITSTIQRENLSFLGLSCLGGWSFAEGRVVAGIRFRETGTNSCGIRPTITSADLPYFPGLGASS